MAKTGYMPPKLKGFLITPEPTTPTITPYYGWLYTLDDKGNVIKISDKEYAVSTSQVVDIPSYGNVSSVSLKLTGADSGFLIVFLDKDENVLSHSNYGTDNANLTLNVPQGATIIRYPVSAGSSVAVSLGVMTPHEVTDDVINWDELEYSEDRNGIGGVFPGNMNVLKLRNKSMEFVKNLFYKEGLFAKVRFEGYRRDRFDLNKYTLKQSVALEFGEYKEDEDHIEIGGFSTDINAYLNSLGSTNYDIRVSDVADSKPWNYDRITLLNMGTYTIPEERLSVAGGRYRLFINLDKAEMTPGSEEHDLKKQTSGREDPWDQVPPYGDYCFKAAANVSIVVNLSFIFQASSLLLSGEGFSLSLSKFNNGNETLLKTWITHQIPTPPDKQGYGFFGEVSINEKISANLLKDDQLVLYVSKVNKSPDYIWILDFKTFTIEYQTKGNPIYNISVINPETLLQSYLNKITGGPGLFTAKIIWRESTSQIPEPKLMLCAGESIRNFADAYIHGNIDDFIHWMQSRGYDYEIAGNEFIFRDRNHFFNPNTTALSLKKNEMAGLIVAADKSYAFTSFKIGYERQDYESVNGKFEVNGTYDYDTGLRTHINENNYEEIISPYRADSIGIELLFHKYDEKITDNKADNDIFVIAMTEESGHYRIYDDIMIQSISEGQSVSLFNAPLNPHYMVLNNESRIGISSKSVKFTATDTNRDFKINNSSVPTVINITKQLFAPIRFNFAAGTHLNLPEGTLKYGLIKFQFKGREYKGYIDSISKNALMEMESTWELLAKFD